MTIQEMRLSFIRMETLVLPLAALDPPAISYAFLLSDVDYAQQYATALTETGIHRPPWHDQTGKMFWFDYFGRISPSKLTKKDAWQGLAPLETQCITPVPAHSTPGNVAAHAYLYPWGITATADVTVKGSWTLEQAVQLAFGLKHRSSYQLTGTGGTKELPLNAAINSIIADVRTTAYGAEIPSVTGEGFSLVTVLDADGVDVDKPVDQNVHQALEALTSWNPDWKSIQLGDLKDSLIRIRKAPSSHALYASKRGRAVWFPAGFRSVTTSADRLDCYHNNLMMATLQTDSLCRLVAAAAEQLNNGQKKKDWSQTYRNCVRIAAGLLGRIYGGENTYRTRSVKEQIKTYLVSVNAVRHEFEMADLKVKTAHTTEASATSELSPPSSSKTTQPDAPTQ